MASFFPSGHALRKLSEFYILLWGELTRLTGEYRWFMHPTDREPVRTASSVIRELETIPDAEVPRRLTLSSELDRTLSLKSLFETAGANERPKLLESIEEIKSSYIERALSFGLWAARNVAVFVSFKAQPGRAVAVANELAQLVGVTEVRLFSSEFDRGEFDGVAICHSSDQQALEYLLGIIKAVKGIVRVSAQYSVPGYFPLGS